MSVKASSSKSRNKSSGKSELDCNDSLYYQILENAADGSSILDFNGKVLYVNKMASQLLGLPMKKIVGKEVYAFLPKEFQSRARDYINEIKRKGINVRDEFDILNPKRKKLPVEFTAAPLRKSGKVVSILVIFRDVSHRKREEMFTRETEKMKALQHFISGTSQEIAHPLRGLRDRVQQLLRQIKNKDFEYIGYKDFLGIIASLESMKEQIEYCSDTTERLIQISREKVGLKSRRCDVNQTIREAVKMIKHHLKTSDIILSTNWGKKLPPAAINGFELSQVVIKVLTNSIQALPGGGKIAIKTRYRLADKKIEISVKDDGVGISKEDIPYVFEPFFTTKKRGLEKSSGLGLAIVYSIIKAYQGKIEIQSSLRHGTQIKIIFPGSPQRPSGRPFIYQALFKEAHKK